MEENGINKHRDAAILYCVFLLCSLHYLSGYLIPLLAVFFIWKPFEALLRGRERVPFWGVKLAPLSIPTQRRLQTLVVLYHVMNITVNPQIVTAAIIYLLFTRLWFASVGYLIWLFYDINYADPSSHGSRHSEFLRRSVIYRLFRDYFPIELVKTSDLDPKKNYIMGYHPHGVIGFGAMCNFGTEATGFSDKFPGIIPHMITLKMNFKMPVLRANMFLLGMCDSSRESISYILSKKGTGNAAIIVVGGAAEALHAQPGNYDLYLKNRKGFVRLALETGSSLVPIFSFGENELFRQAENPSGSPLRKFQEMVKQIVGVSPILFYGRGIFNYTFGLLPYRTPITTVVGAAIDVPMIEKPSQEIVDKYHMTYMDSLSVLFNEHKTNYGVDENMHLNFV